MTERPTRAISIRQPWATAIVFGEKDIENRTWPTKFRGRAIIQAGLQMGHDWWDWERLERDMELLTGGPLPLGAFIGEVEITDCIPIEDWDAPEDCPNPWAWGPYCWVLKDAIAYPEPIPAKGHLGLFKVEL
jgi:hypothetical protein